ncbi:MAG: hypothetical protein RQ842_10180 [Vulcanisaeta sp.]|nr:hypothetical protein [Vulcanisaeta sp.]
MPTKPYVGGIPWKTTFFSPFRASSDWNVAKRWASCPSSPSSLASQYATTSDPYPVQWLHGGLGFRLDDTTQTLIAY